jgi:uncharacterized Fe-S cluster-containing radical SAM superfamily protein
MFDPLELAKQTEEIVCKSSGKKFYRFRPAKFYGGIATADCVGCCLRCLFCWSWNTVTQADKVGKFYSPKEVANNLISIARKHNFNQIRISGNEPTIGFKHLLDILENLKNSKLKFILETNGILIGYNESYVKELSKYKDFLHVRISLKGTTPEEFSKLTGAKPEFFELQIQALKNLISAEIPCHPAVMISFSQPESIERLRDRLETINHSLYDFEEETLLFYGDVKKRLDEAGIEFKS